MGLYEDLGVDRAASPGDINSAFRKAARRAHPDAPGGSAEAFARISRAKSVLLDPRRRAEYDRTGRVEEPAPNNDLSEAVGILMSCVMGVLEAVAKSGWDFGHFDVLGATREQLEIQVKEGKKDEAKARADVEKLRAIARRFGARKDAVNQIRRSIEARADEIERVAEGHAARLKYVAAALEILAGHTYEFEPMQVVMMCTT